MNILIQDISHAFRTGSSHFISKAEAAFEHSPVKMRTGFQAKIVVDLFMSIECALKSLLCSRDPAGDPEATLRAIFKYGHDLKKLMKYASPTSLNEADIKTLKELNNKGVALRYDLDLASLLTSELLLKDTVKFNINPEYVENLMRIANLVSEEADENHKKTFTALSPLMTRKQIEKQVAELRALHKKARTKNAP